MPEHHSDPQSDARDWTLARLKRNDQEAWKMAFPELWQIACRAVSRFQFRPEDLRDLAQSSLAEASEMCNRCVDEDHLRRMTAYIATLKAKEFLRYILAQKRNRNKEAPIEDASTVASAEVARLNSVEVEEVLIALDPIDRALLEGKALEGLDSRELAERHGLNRSSVRTRIKRAIDLLKRRGKSGPSHALRALSLLISFVTATGAFLEARPS